MLLPSFFENSFNFFDDFFTTPRMSLNTISSNQMHTDVQEYDDRYELGMDLPGYTKEDINADLKDGYLTVSAKKDEENNEKDNKGKYIRRERYYGQCQRSFYVGDNITEDDIKASFKDGVLKIAIPKKQTIPEVEEKRYIQID